MSHVVCRNIFHDIKNANAVNNVMLLLGLTDTIKAIFPPFPLPGFVPNFTGYDLDKLDMDWYDVYKTVTPDDDVVSVRTTSSVTYCW